MFRIIFSALGAIIRVFAILAVIICLGFVGFVAYKGSQPMHQKEANGMTYWQIMREQVEVNGGLPAKCRSLYLVSYLTVLPHALMYTYVGVFPESYLAKTV